jgi:hypothetical protein
MGLEIAVPRLHLENRMKITCLKIIFGGKFAQVNWQHSVIDEIQTKKKIRRKFLPEYNWVWSIWELLICTDRKIPMSIYFSSKGFAE